MKTNSWCRNFLNFSVDQNWKTEVLPQLVSKFDLSLAQDVKTALASLKYKVKSPKFETQLVEKYCSTFESQSAKDWKQLEICESFTEKDSATIFCGGSVSSLDWAPAGNLNFLAVASNSQTQGIKMNLTASSKASVQLYEVNQLVNQK